MANFNTHFNVAAVITGLTAAVLLSAEHISLNTALGLWFLGTIGGLLPDIDSDNSTSLDIIVNLFSFSAVLIVIRHMTGIDSQQISLSELIVIPLLIYAVIRYFIRPIFEKITVHRGSCHSLLFVLLMALATTQVVWRLTLQVTEQSLLIAWLSGVFVFLGGLTHLVLDEVYSVDLSNVRLKRSFGSALKLAELKNKSLTLLTMLAIIGLVYSGPAAQESINTLSNWSKLKLTPYAVNTDKKA